MEKLDYRNLVKRFYPRARCTEVSVGVLCRQYEITLEPGGPIVAAGTNALMTWEGAWEAIRKSQVGGDGAGAVRDKTGRGDSADRGGA